MGERNYLVEGLSGTGKTSVCHALRRRGLHAVNGDRELAYQGDPATGEPTDTGDHEHHVWDEQRVRAMAADRSEPVTFFCGGSRNFARFLDVFDTVFVLQADPATLEDRLAARPPGEWGSTPEQRAFVLDLHRTGGDVPDGVAIDGTRPLDEVVEEILRLTR